MRKRINPGGLFLLSFLISLFFFFPPSHGKSGLSLQVSDSVIQKACPKPIWDHSIVWKGVRDKRRGSASLSGGGRFPAQVLDEALQKLLQRCGLQLRPPAGRETPFEQLFYHVDLEKFEPGESYLVFVKMNDYGTHVASVELNITIEGGKSGTERQLTKAFNELLSATLKEIPREKRLVSMFAKEKRPKKR